MEGEQFLTYNFATLSKDAGVWSYRDIQKLCVSLGISARGKRGQLVRKLAEWHRSRYEDDSCLVPLIDPSSEENIPMNVLGNNFGLLPVNVTTEKSPPSSRSKSRKRKRSFPFKPLMPLQARLSCAGFLDLFSYSFCCSLSFESVRRTVSFS